MQVIFDIKDVFFLLKKKDFINPVKRIYEVFQVLFGELLF